jgi:PTH1 family peptidyl-tRNA hydrolase
MWVFCGLGNPGKKYERTRHNFGFMVVSAFAERHRLRFKSDELYPAEVASLNRTCLLFKPMTFMNLSGIAVKKLLKQEKIKPEELLVIHDDMDLPLGRIKLLPKGGAGGHNGVKSIISELGVNTFPRLKLGIGRPPEGVDPRDYVLSPFTPDEAPIVEKVIEIATQALEDLLQEDLLKVMTKYNSQKI